MNFIFKIILLFLKTTGSLSQMCGVHRNTIYTLRGTDCGGKCVDFNKHISCNGTNWVTGCFCKPGYNRDSEWNCIPEYQCPKQKPNNDPSLRCGRDAVFARCGNLCLNSCERVNGRNCLKNSCDDGCFCKRGFFRSEKGKCVTMDLCKKSAQPKRCGKNAVTVECGNRCKNSCEGLIKRHCPEHSCDDGCFCDWGYWRNKKGVCVQRKECLKDFKVNNFKAVSKSCPKKSIFAKCGNLCKNSCEGLIKRNCPKDSCDNDCFCEPGLWRNKKGDCVPPDQCKLSFQDKPKICGKNSILVKCGNLCKNQCKSLIERNCPQNSCDDGCFCDKGLWRNDQGDCVKEEECKYDAAPEPDKCPKNQTLIKCGNLCKNNCEGLIKRNCPDTSCDTGCFCAKGFWKNKKGVCVPKDECENDYGKKKLTKKGKRCAKNAVFAKCGNLCKNGCKSLRRKGRCPQKRCDDGCFCVSGYWRNINGICVKKKECHPKMLKDKLKIHIKNGNSTKETDEVTEPEDAEEDDVTIGTTDSVTEAMEDTEPTPESTESSVISMTTAEEHDTETESNGMTEQEHHETTESSQTTEPTTGLVSENSISTTTQEMTGETKEEDSEMTTTQLTTTETTEPPLKCKINEHYSKCGSSCGESCNLQNANSNHSCAPECHPGCFCNEGLLRNDNGICVPPEQCICKLPEQKCHDSNEEFFWCHNECGRTCADQSSITEKKCLNKCSRGCLCREGFVRNELGVCVEPKKCGKTQKKCGTNEIYSKCGTDCGKGCEDLNKNGTKQDCKACSAGCFCAKGYHRNQNGLCVQKDDCEYQRKGLSKTKNECQSDEEYTECGDFCTENCENSLENVEYCPYSCVKGCHCRKGYKRNAEGICVEESKCKDKPKCKTDEEFSDCGSDCGYRCLDLSKTNIQCPLSCEKGCFCTSGYFRERNNTCVKKEECVVDPMECPDKEQYKKCGTRCSESCEDLRNPVKCPEECEEGCFCQSGLYRDIEGNCVNKTECELEPTQKSIPDCPSNEVFKECGNKCDESCEDRVGCKSDCKNGCFCDEGHLRHKTGKCVADDQCKALEQCVECDSNEYYTDCGSDCANFCSDLGTDLQCTESCRKGCFCKYGFYKNKLGKCVTKEKCLKTATYFSKSGGPGNTTSTSTDNIKRTLVTRKPKFKILTEKSEVVTKDKPKKT